MPNLGAGMAILSGEKILLTMREDFHAWCLPGGEVEEGESLAQMALREAKEEIGLEVCIERLVGIYSLTSPERSSHEIIFAGHPVGGELHPDPHEVADAGWFELHDLPDPIVPWKRQQIRDALAGVGASTAWRQEYIWPFPPELTRADLYRLRDESGLTRLEFFGKYFAQGDFPEVREA
jgi:ADP-ribose pyrophosphatase YjhB (NUDIX family)